VFGEWVMILGNVGGTHTNAVLIKDGKLKAKVIMDEDKMLDSLSKATAALMNKEDPRELERVVLSTTIPTNAMIPGKVNKVSLFIVSGPGLSPANFCLDGDAHFVFGYVNHRGIEISEVDEDEISRIGLSFFCNPNL
jgi:N-methylhydantoinase A